MLIKNKIQRKKSLSENCLKKEKGEVTQNEVSEEKYIKVSQRSVDNLFEEDSKWVSTKTVVVRYNLWQPDKILPHQ